MLVGGHTELGRQINKTSRKSETQDVGKFKTARAIILKPSNDTYSFYMGLLNSRGEIIKETIPIALIGGDETTLSLLFGTPQNLSRGQGSAWEVIIFYTGASVDKGVALVSRRLYEVAGGRFEATKVANELLVKGTAYAPPGAGV
jgi:hypothetical protein